MSVLSNFLKELIILSRPFIIGFFAFLLTGCAAPLVFFGAGVGTMDAATQTRGASGVISDSHIRAEINGYWFDDNIDLYRNVLLAVQDGRVMVMGYLPTDAQRARAIELAWQAPGVKEVINEILIGPEPSPSSSFEDVWISTKIRTKMLTTEDFSSNNYSITTLNGVVYLLGISSNPQEQQQALEICKSTSGVTKVVNHLLISNQNAPMSISQPEAKTSVFNPENNSSVPITPPSHQEVSMPHTPSPSTFPSLTKEEADGYLRGSSLPPSSSGIQEESLAPPAF